MSWRVCAAILLVLVMTRAEAQACKGKTVLFEDKFTTVEKGWTTDDKTAIGKGALTITPDPNTGWSAIYQARRFEAADMCVDFIATNVMNPKDLQVQFIFLADGYPIKTYAVLDGSGVGGVSRTAMGTTLPLVSFQDVQGINFAAGVTHKIRIMHTGDHAEISLNDKKLFDLRVWPMKGGGMFGFTAFSEPKQKTTWSFRNLKVTSVP